MHDDNINLWKHWLQIICSRMWAFTMFTCNSMFICTLQEIILQKVLYKKELILKFNIPFFYYDNSIIGLGDPKFCRRFLEGMVICKALFVTKSHFYHCKELAYSMSSVHSEMNAYRFSHSIVYSSKYHGIYSLVDLSRYKENCSD